MSGKLQSHGHDLHRYLYSRTITVASGQVSGNQSNFPVLLKLTSAGSALVSDFATAGNGGKIQNSIVVNSRTVPADLIFTSDSAGLNLLNWEIESYNPATGDLVVWVQVPSLSSAQNTTFYLYYDNASVTSWKGNTAGTWDNNYVAVWHLADNAANAAGAGFHGQGNHLVNQANTASRIAAGAIGGALAYNGFSDYSKISNSAQSGLGITGNITLQSWVNFNSLPNQGSNITILGKGHNDQTGAYSLGVINPAFVQTLQVGSSSFPNFYGASYPLSSFVGGWHHIVGTWDGSAWRVYLDGLNVVTTASPQGPIFNNEPFVIGGGDSNGGISGLMNGALDEVRVSNTARSAGWIITEFHNQINSAQFYNLGSATLLGSIGSNVPVTINSSPAGLSLTVDSSACTSPCSFQWAPGSTHTLAVTASPQSGGTGTQYVFANWSDTGLQSHSITMGASAASYTANFNTQYFLTTSAGTGGTINPASGWYNSGTVVAVSATANSGNQFTGFSGALSGTTTPQNVTMSAPATVSASFSSTATAAVTVSSSPAGLSLTVDSSACTSPCSFQWAPGSTHTLAVTASPQSGGTGTQYVFANWSDTGLQSHSITMGASAASYTANFTTQYFLTTSAGTGGTINPASGWYNSGAVVAVSAAANSGNQFTGFSGALSGTTTPQNVTMSAPATVSASFSATATTSAGYLYSRTITVASAQVSGSQSNFPVLLKLTSAGSGTVSDFATAANGGKIQNSIVVNSRTVPADLVFTSDSTGTNLLNWEIESYNAATGDLVVWVQVPSLSSAQNTTFYLYYDNASVTNWQGNAAGTWDSNYVGVWHLADNAANPAVLDSTAKGNHLASQVNTSSKITAGEIGGALAYNGFSDYSKISNSAQSGLGITGNITLQSWVNFNSLPNQGSNITILGKGQTDQTGAYSLSVINPAFVQTLQVGSSSFPNFYGASYPLSSFIGGWHHIVGTWDGSAWRVYLDGANVATTSNSQGPISNNEPFVIGGRDFNGGISNLMNGTLDEVRVSNTARSAGWITTEYHNQTNPAQFYSMGSAVSTH